MIKRWVDVLYNIHDNCKGHIGAKMNLGEGAVTSMPNKKKSNVKNINWRRIVRSGWRSWASDLEKILYWSTWIHCGTHNAIYQDNISTMLLETNYQGSSGKRTKHIKARYYMSKDTVDRGDLKNIMVPGRGNRGRCVNRTKTRQRIPSIQKQANKCAGRLWRWKIKNKERIKYHRSVETQNR